MEKIKNLKAVVLDLDGTLLSPDLEVLEETKSTLRKIKNNGVKLIIATGRTPQTAIPMTNSIGIKTPMVLANGALIYDPCEKKIIDSNSISKETVTYLLDLSKKINKSLNIYTPNLIYMEEDKIDAYIEDSGDKKENLINQDKLDLDKEIVLKCEFFGKGEGNNPKLKTIVENARNDLDEDLYLTTAHINYLEILNKNVNKLNGIREVLNLYAIQDEEVLLFGDSHNDVEMLDNFPHSVAMGNAEKCAKNVAKYVTKSNSNNGISYFISNFTDLM
ncbi:MAG: HAD family hydrolase [Pleomorphochaeta sp.]